MRKLVIVVLLIIPTLRVSSHPAKTNTVIRPKPWPLTLDQFERLASWKEGDQNFWELSGQTEGDMVLLPEQKNWSIENNYQWENTEIPYELSPVFSVNQANIIHEAVKDFFKSCVTVRPRVGTDIDFVYVTAEKTGCWANVGRLGGNQTINLQIDGCLTRQTIVHEFLHAAGFHHQHSAIDRDFYIGIDWRNIQKGDEDNFEKYEYGNMVVNDVRKLYDYGSIMHYSEKAFSANGQATIIPLNGAWLGMLGRAVEMSEVDVEKLNAMYCNDESFSIWMYVVMSAVIVLLLSLIIGVLIRCLCLSFCLSCCCCKAICCCV